MRFTMEVGGITQLQRAITLIREVSGVIDAQRK
jgi:GTP pyrophosphokinase